MLSLAKLFAGLQAMGCFMAALSGLAAVGHRNAWPFDPGIFSLCTGILATAAFAFILHSDRARVFLAGEFVLLALSFAAFAVLALTRGRAAGAFLLLMPLAVFAAAAFAFVARDARDYCGEERR